MEDRPKKEELNKKMDFKDVADKRDEFFKESEEFSGKEIEVTFKLDYNGDNINKNKKSLNKMNNETQKIESFMLKMSDVLRVGLLLPFL